jgi:hypothetical protein
MSHQTLRTIVQRRTLRLRQLVWGSLAFYAVSWFALLCWLIPVLWDMGKLQ